MPTTPALLRRTVLAHASAPENVGPELRRRLIDCWIAVTNAGGAAGFPFPPVTEADVAPVTDTLLGRLAPDGHRLITATVGRRLAGWVVLGHDPNPLVAHWGTVHHLQTHPDSRGLGLGAALMRELHRLARDELSLTRLRLAVRGGEGLESFYGSLGWTETGRWPNALRLGPAPEDTRDEVLMGLELRPEAGSFMVDAPGPGPCSSRPVRASPTACGWCDGSPA
ncbi:GNAT family N-acetyltransferase [Streptomyces roseicoloratus]|uniref:GNAT family N-acetyltransferase n=1 Tax=Streptomyces roseicoloratus TaxID=2508722 RepID=UPI001009C4D4